MNKNVFGVIYCLTGPTDKKYIGLSTNFKIRLLSYERGYCKTQPKIYRAIKKYGFESFDVCILKECYTKEELDESEKYFIKYYNSVENGYNCDYGGCRGLRLTPETRLKLSISHKGRYPSEETRKKQSLVKMGKVPTEETRRKISIANSGRIMSEESIQKMKKAKNTEIHKEIARRNGYRNEIKTVYKFKNLNTGEIYEGTKNSFIKNKNMCRPCVYDLVNKKLKTSNNWILYNE